MPLTTLLWKAIKLLNESPGTTQIFEGSSIFARRLWVPACARSSHISCMLVEPRERIAARLDGQAQHRHKTADLIEAGDAYASTHQ
jgi:hypothetical protein